MDLLRKNLFFSILIFSTSIFLAAEAPAAKKTKKQSGVASAVREDEQLNDFSKTYKALRESELKAVKRVESNEKAAVNIAKKRNYDKKNTAYEKEQVRTERTIIKASHK